MLTVSTVPPSARASPQVSFSAAAASLSAASSSPSMPGEFVAALPSTRVLQTVSTSALTVGSGIFSGTGFDEGAVQCDLKIMEDVDKEDTPKLSFSGARITINEKERHGAS